MNINVAASECRGPADKPRVDGQNRDVDNSGRREIKDKEGVEPVENHWILLEVGNGIEQGDCFNGGDVFFYFFLQKSLYTSIKMRG